MADFYNIDKAKADAWVEDVNSEIQIARSILNKVTTACATPAGEDDTIMQGIEDTAKTLENFWDQMLNGFEHVGRNLVTIMSKLKEAMDKVSDEIATAKSKIGT